MAPSEPRRVKEGWRCFACVLAGHLARDCPSQDEDMPSVATGEGKLRPCHYLTMCWAHQGAAPPRLPVKVEGRDTEALLDSGSAITLIRPEYAGRSGGVAVMVSCVHGNTRRYPTTGVRLQTPRGQCQVRVGVVRGLLVPVLLGRDCALFQSYWQGGAPLPEEPRRRRARGNRGSPLPVCVVTTESETELPCTEPASKQREEDSETVTAPERVPEGTLSDFRPEQQKHPEAPTDFGTAQLQVPNFLPYGRRCTIPKPTAWWSGSIKP